MKVPEPRKLKSGNYFIQLRLDGVSIPITAPTAKECKQQAALIKAEHSSGATQRLKISVADAISKYMLNRQRLLSPSTLRGYRSIAGYFSDIADRELAKIEWQKVINNMAANYEAKTIKNSWRFMCSVMRDNDITPPRVLLPPVVPKDLPFLEPEQILSFLKAIEGEECELAALLALHSLRRSEILGLSSSDIDLKANTIRVAGAVVYDQTHKPVHKATNKNASSTRTIPIMIPRLAELAKLLPKGPVYTSNPNTMWAQINRICERNELPAVGIHGLRRSFASLAYHLGWSEAYTMEIGGWSDPQTMRKIYIKLAQKDRIKQSNNMSEFYKSANGN